MRSLWRRQPPESGDAQLPRVTAATAPDVATGPEADLPTQLARLRAILELAEYYFNPHRGPLHAAIAAKLSTPERPLTARRVALIHEADPAHLGDVTADELAQIAGIAGFGPRRLARDPQAAASAASSLDFLQALALCQHHLGGQPRVRPDPDLRTDQGRHAYAAALRRELRRRHPEAVADHPRLNWGRREDGPPGPPPPRRPVPRALVVAEVARMLPFLCAAEQLVALGAQANPAPLDLGDDFAREAARRNQTDGFCYHFRGSIGSANWPIYLADAELEEALRQAREAQRHWGG